LIYQLPIDLELPRIWSGIVVTWDKPELGEMRSKPQFEVDIIKGNSTLSFTCTFLQGEAQEGEYSEC